MKKILIVMFAFLMILTSCTVNGGPAKNPPDTDSSGTKEEPTPTVKAYDVYDLFPEVLNKHMVYNGEGNEFAEHETYVDFVRGNVVQIRDINPGTTMAKVYEIGDGIVRLVFSQGESYEVKDYTASRNKDEVILKEPIAVGTEWTVNDGATRKITAVDMDVTVPAGSYKCVEITTDNKDSIDKSYYAPGIGLVKTEFTSKEGNYLVTSELEKIE
ncbi:hypothetical protein OXPF_30930 [Oxobacter pfennigii]|uniref:DUF3108 domain-containing protein n=1 Tax=Oxobacter pfennigii TaxID=36849 RepID=A0A0P8W6K3_9CLOT|nr:hypothetical protein [Oxobacter pfennigii]KPU43651.1 hypothetical protein OXPF_30930 [Oxobacter pfennigii]